METDNLEDKKGIVCTLSGIKTNKGELNRAIVSSHYVVGEVSTATVDDANEEVHTSEVFFEAGSRTHWHSHLTTQIVIGKEGEGYIQSRGDLPIMVLPGDVVVIPPNEIHCHVAGAHSVFTHIAIQIEDDLGNVERALTQAEYDLIIKID